MQQEFRGFTSNLPVAFYYDRGLIKLVVFREL